MAEDICKTCNFHKPGVFIVGVGGLLFLALILKVYWSEIVILLRGRWTRLPQTIENRPPFLISSKTLGTVTSSNTTDTLPLPVIIQQSPVPGGGPSFSMNSRGPRMTLATGISQSVSKSHKPIVSHREASRVRGKSPNTMAAYESTGSNYFKQMIRGKKPITSISQYMLKKGKKKKDKTKHKKRDDTTKARQSNKK